MSLPTKGGKALNLRVKRPHRERTFTSRALMFHCLQKDNGKNKNHTVWIWHTQTAWRGVRSAEPGFYRVKGGNVYWRRRRRQVCSTWKTRGTLKPQERQTMTATVSQRLLVKQSIPCVVHMKAVGLLCSTHSSLNLTVVRVYGLDTDAGVYIRFVQTGCTHTAGYVQRCASSQLVESVLIGL